MNTATSLRGREDPRVECVIDEVPDPQDDEGEEDPGGRRRPEDRSGSPRCAPGAVATLWPSGRHLLTPTEESPLRTLENDLLQEQGEDEEGDRPREESRPSGTAVVPPASRSRFPSLDENTSVSTVTFQPTENPNLRAVKTNGARNGNTISRCRRQLVTPNARDMSIRSLGSARIPSATLMSPRRRWSSRWRRSIPVARTPRSPTRSAPRSGREIPG